MGGHFAIRVTEELKPTGIRKNKLPRIRTIKPDFFLDSELAKMSLAARYFFIGLWTQADKEGRIECDIPKLKVQIIPYDKISAEKCIAELTPKFIISYQGNGKNYLLVNNFTKHQRPHHTEPESKIPPPSKEYVKDGYYPFRNGQHEDEQSKLEEGKEGKGKDTGEGKGKALVIPEDLQASKEDIENWLAYKREKGQSYKPTGLNALWGALRKIPESGRKSAIEQSMANNYAGIFPARGDQNGKVTGGAKPIPGKYGA